MADIWWNKAKRQWCVDVALPGRKKRQRWYLGADEVEARQQFHLRMSRLYGEQSHGGRGPDYTLSELAELWLDWNRTNRAEKTTLARLTYLRWIVLPYGHLPATAVMPRHVEEIKRQHLRTNAPKSVNHYVRAIKGLYNWAVKQGLLKASPIQHVPMVRQVGSKRLAQPVKRIARALRICDAQPPLGDAMRVLYRTGMRIGELIGLPWDAYDARLGVLMLQAHKTVGRTGEPRQVPVSRKAARVLLRQPQCGKAIFSFPDGRAMQFWVFSNRLKRLKVKYPKRLAGITFHALRHTFVSRLMAAGVPEWEMQRIVGHKSTLMIRYYAKADQERLKRAVELL